jgi:hypothetical protein
MHRAPNSIRLGKGIPSRHKPMHGVMRYMQWNKKRILLRGTFFSEKGSPHPSKKQRELSSA